MSRLVAVAFAFLCATANVAGAAQMTPMDPGFHQHLPCNRGYVTIDVSAARLRDEPRAVMVTTTIALGGVATKTRALRVADLRGNIYALGYVGAGGVPKRFQKRLLLPASPLSAGGDSNYLNVRGMLIQKRFEGMKAGGYVFSDYLTGRKLNSVTYVPAIGIAAARFFGMPPDGSDLICGLRPAR